MAKSQSPYRRVRKLPRLFKKPLEAYDEECKRGLVQTAEYDQRGEAHRGIPSVARV